MEQIIVLRVLKCSPQGAYMYINVDVGSLLSPNKLASYRVQSRPELEELPITVAAVILQVSSPPTTSLP